MNKTLKYAFIGIFCALLIAAAAALFIARAYWHGDGLGFGKNYVAERLDLDRGQRDLFGALSSELFAIRDDLRAQQRGALRDALALLAAERFDRGRATGLASAHTALLDQYAARAITAFGNFADSLDPNQRAELREMARSIREKRWDWD